MYVEGHGEETRERLTSSRGWGWTSSANETRVSMSTHKTVNPYMKLRLLAFSMCWLLARRWVAMVGAGGCWSVNF